MNKRLSELLSKIPKVLLFEKILSHLIIILGFNWDYQNIHFQKFKLIFKNIHKWQINKKYDLEIYYFILANFFSHFLKSIHSFSI